ncbi:MAG: ABC transporter substrate-binding protein [Acetatifactor sp.]|nr:ABC transporter substrate-binding protein [Acetatifactor sp.]
MRKKLIAVLLIATLAVATIGCGSDTQRTSTGTVANASAGGEKTEVETISSEARTLAEELLTRNVTEKDVVTEEVVEATIQVLKETYEFENLNELRVNDDESSLIADRKGWYNKLYNDSGIKVVVAEGSSKHQLESLESGEINIAWRMWDPVIAYLAHGAELTIVNVSEHPLEEISQAIVLKDSGITEFSQLKGKRISTSRTTCSYYTLNEMADEEGWTENVDYEFVNVADTEAKSALIAGEIDGLVMHQNPSVNNLLLDGTAVVLRNAVADGIYVNKGGGRHVVYGLTDWIGSHKNVVKVFVKLNQVIKAYILQNLDESAALYEDISRVPAKNTIYWLECEKNNWYFTEEPLESISKDSADLLEYSKSIGDAPADAQIDFDAVLDEEFFNQGQ